jgi:hypothetical protein
MWNYVAPDYRRSRNADALIHFGFDLSMRLSAAYGFRVPFIAGLLTNKQTAAKVRLYRRMFGNPAGAFFVFNSDWQTEPFTDYTDLRKRLRKFSAECTDRPRDISAKSIRQEIAPLLREAADMAQNLDNLWEGSKANGAGAERTT